MKIKLATLAVLVTAALACPYTKATAQGCTSNTGATNGASFSTATYSGSLFSWSNPGNAQLSDASYASGGVSLGALSNAKSDYLTVKNFGFSIPSTATICEIIVEVQRSASGLGIGGDVADQSVRLLQNGALYGNDLANPAAAWPASDGTATYGSALLASAWGGSWQPSDVNNPNFGVAISAQLNTGLIGLFMQGKINQVKVTIIYDPNTILNLSLENFAAAISPDGEGRRLSWTASAGAGSRFIIQRSANSTDWQDIATVMGDAPETMATGSAETTTTDAGGGTPPTASPAITGSSIAAATGSLAGATAAGNMHGYTYLDHTPLDGVNFYRVRMESAGGKILYSTISEVRADKGVTRCWPNPFTQTIHVAGSPAGSRIVVKDLQGRSLYVKTLTAAASDWQISTNNMPPGLYFVQVGTETFRLLKEAK